MAGPSEPVGRPLNSARAFEKGEGARRAVRIGEDRGDCLALAAVSRMFQIDKDSRGF